jgi:hypothetical protein
VIRREKEIRVACPIYPAQLGILDLESEKRERLNGALNSAPFLFRRESAWVLRFAPDSFELEMGIEVGAVEEIPRGLELWNPTLAQRTRKDGAPAVGGAKYMSPRFAPGDSFGMGWDWTGMKLQLRFQEGWAGGDPPSRKRRG